MEMVEKKGWGHGRASGSRGRELCGFPLAFETRVM